MTARAQARGCGPVADALPVELTRLLSAGDRPAREAAWAGFLGAYSPLLERVTRSRGRSHDAAMDAYREARVARRRLVDLVADGVDLASLSEPGATTPREDH